jgi:arginine decarboxylase
LPAYSQGAIVLARTGLLDAARLDRAFEATHTTSPAGSIMASIDAARALLARDGKELCARLLNGVATARQRISQVPGAAVLQGPGVEPTKLVVLLAGTGAHGYAIEDDLVAAGMAVESADRDTVIPIPTIADDEARIAAFTDVLIASIERHRGTPRQPSMAASWTVVPETVLSPREAFFAPTETVDADAAIGRVSAELIAPYPPGVPVLAPGELISRDAVESLREVKAEGGRIAYAADPSLATLQVVARLGTGACCPMRGRGRRHTRGAGWLRNACTASIPAPAKVSIAAPQWKERMHRDIGVIGHRLGHRCG